MSLESNVRALRWIEGLDLRHSFNQMAAKESISAACILSCVGSLKQVSIRLAGTDEIYESNQLHEILSLSGTFSKDGAHLHISVADEQGKVVGGHLNLGNIVYTTFECVWLLLPEYSFSRELDPQTGFKELTIKPV